MRTKGIVVLLVAAVVGSSPAFSQEAEEDPTLPRSYQGIEYRSGGVGKEERDVLIRHGGEYNLKLVFARKRDTAFVANVSVTVEDEAGNKVLEAVSKGPWFLTRLPAGTYRVTAALEGTALPQTTRIAEGKQTQLAFYWPIKVD